MHKLKNKTKKQVEVERSESRPTESELINTDIFAAAILWHPESVRRACRQERIHAVKVGRGWRIPRTVAEEIFKNGMPCPP